MLLPNLGGHFLDYYLKTNINHLLGQSNQPESPVTPL